MSIPFAKYFLGLTGLGLAGGLNGQLRPKSGKVMPKANSPVSTPHIDRDTEIPIREISLAVLPVMP